MASGLATVQLPPVAEEMHDGVLEEHEQGGIRFYRRVERGGSAHGTSLPRSPR